MNNYLSVHLYYMLSYINIPKYTYKVCRKIISQNKILKYSRHKQNKHLTYIQISKMKC